MPANNLFALYSEDYFTSEEKALINNAEKLVKSIRNGTFEHDTSESDRILNSIKYFINKIDI